MSDLRSSEIAYGERIGSGGSDSILASYFRDILKKLDIPSDRFQALLDRYIINQGIANTSAELSTNRSALRRELVSMTMTWKVFMKGLRFLRIVEVRMRLTLFRDGHKTTHHECTFEVNKELPSEGGEETNTLAKFFQGILEDLQIDDDMFQDYLDEYVKFAKPKTISGVSMEDLPKLIAQKKAEEAQVKCSLRREILKDRISWKVFVRGLMFLGARRVHFELRFLHRNNMVTKHEKFVSFK